MASFDGRYRARHGAQSAYARLMERTFGAGQLVGQQGLCAADQILDLARQLEVRPGRRLLDVCCGMAVPPS
jgi:hypothetical protein